MNDAAPFEVRYRSEDGLAVQLEAAPRIDGAGRPYTHHRLVVADGRPGAVILATRGGEVLLVRSFRSSVGREMWELPRGAGEASDAGRATGSAEEAAASEGAELRTGVRELREETGYTAQHARLLGGYVIDSTVLPQRMGVVRCEVAPAAEPGPTDGEVEEVRWFSDEEVRRFVIDGTIADAHSLSGLAMWLAEGGPGE